jgi:hypothetical protein
LATTEQELTATDQAVAYVQALSQIEALVFRDVDCNGVYELSEPKLDKIGLGLRLGNRPPITRTTNPLGMVQFADLLSGVYTIKLDAASLPQKYELREGDLTRIMTITIPNFYTTTFPLTLPANTDSDEDGTPDCKEGSGDSDGDGTPDYMDKTKLFYLTTVMR